MKAPEGKKFVIVFTMPSGKRYVAGGIDGKFALIPITPEGQLKGILGWDDSFGASQWLKELKNSVTEKQWETYWSMRPDLKLVSLQN